MKTYIYFLFMLLLAIGPACDADYSGSDDDTGDENLGNTTPPTSSKNPAVPPMNYLLIPGESVGMINASSTEADIIQAYGESHVQQREIGLGEGETAPGTIVFPGTDNELVIQWQEGQTYEKIKSIRIDGAAANWATRSGIRIGTTLEELVSINGRDFKFYGFEWDYAGATNEWEGGQISKNLTVILTPSNPEATFPDLLGDELFPSSHPKAEAADLSVSSITIHFD